MCLGIPMQVISLEGDDGVVEVGGVRQRASLLLLEDVQVGDYVIVHAGFAISRLDPEEAKATLTLLEGVISSGEAAHLEGSRRGSGPPPPLAQRSA